MMSDEELAAALNTGALRLTFPGVLLVSPDEDQQACLRYRYSLPKLIGEADIRSTQFMALEARLNRIRETMEQGLALLFADPVAIAGRVSPCGMGTAVWKRELSGSAAYASPAGSQDAS
jgi:hypothetical protein